MLKDTRPIEQLRRRGRAPSSPGPRMLATLNSRTPIMTINMTTWSLMKIPTPPSSHLRPKTARRRLSSVAKSGVVEEISHKEGCTSAVSTRRPLANYSSLGRSSQRSRHTGALLATLKTSTRRRHRVATCPSKTSLAKRSPLIIMLQVPVIRQPPQRMQTLQASHRSTGLLLSATRH